ncbi:hypothetical protein M0805_005822 [Coniferiporia weirii]|nr:hypothetical protein M0805_005822 [Coniferiporia weirii]
MSFTPEESRAAFAVPQEHDAAAQDILSVGKQCAARSCGVVDFLPTKCNHCSDFFCTDHQRPESHDCAKWDPSAADRRAHACPVCSSLIAIPPGEDPNVRMERHINSECVVVTGAAVGKTSAPVCSQNRCGKLLWQPIDCEKCHKKFCATHRYPDVHSCPSAASKQSSQPTLMSQANAKKVAALAAFKRSVAASSSNNRPSPKPAPKRAPALPTPSSTSTSAPAGSVAAAVSSGGDKVKATFSSKGRPEPSLSLHAPVPPPVSGDAVNNKRRAPTTPTSSRCASDQQSTSGSRSFVPRSLFGTA